MMTAAAPEVRVAGLTLPVYSVNTLIIGSGAAGLNAALQLVARGQRDILLVTERWGAGASNEAGSDKQTYYKLSLAHDKPDAPRLMAEDLYRGGGMHGDIALCEAQHSAEAFYHLVQRGVPFPHDPYGAYVGYRTDHDPRGRATSAGPLTSHQMCQCLGQAVRDEGVPILDHHPVVALLTYEAGSERHVCGAVAIDARASDDQRLGLVLLNAVNVVLATGGPGGMYHASAYPESQVGATGLGLAVGAVAQNLTESQFGLASVGFRWNVSGSYQQVIPRYVSMDPDGRNPREFLNDHFPDMGALAGAIFRKGYEWPFDCTKVRDHGSSLIDLLVYEETVRRGRRVYLDYMQNPTGTVGLEAFSLEQLDHDARSYLGKSDALRDTPIERLRAMNEPAYQLFRQHDVDLARAPLEIGVCAQHNNGGLRGNLWWESNIRHLFPVGEVNGSHGVRRPGGAALNAGQVGSLRAALFISKRYSEPAPRAEEFQARAAGQIERCVAFARQVVGEVGGSGMSPMQCVGEIQERMSAHAAMGRELGHVTEAAVAAWQLYHRARQELTVTLATALPEAFRALDLGLTHAVYLEALREYLERGGQSRGSYLVWNAEGKPAAAGLDDWRFSIASPTDLVSGRILEVWMDQTLQVHKQWVDIRPIPEVEGWFETVWRDYVHDRVVR